MPMLTSGKEKLGTETRLRRLIEGCTSDKYIGEDEESEIFFHAEALGIRRYRAEELLNRVCKIRRWIRETEIACFLHIMLEEANEKNGVINETDFNRFINYAVALRMPRSTAMQLSVKYVSENQLPINRRRDGYEPIRRKHSL